MAKIEIPTTEYERELTPGAIKGAMKTAQGTEKAGLWMVPVGSIRRLDGFNVRVITPDYVQHRDELALSIQANGFYPDKPLAGYVAKEGDNNVIYLTDGYTRLSAAELAIERGAEIERLPVIVKPLTDNIEDLTVALVQANEGRPLSPFEKSIVVKRLVGYGMEKAEIARRLGMTERYVGDLEVLAGAPSKVRNLLINGKVSSTEAIKQLRKDPKKAADKLTEAVKTADAKGKSKATGKDVAPDEDEEQKNVAVSVKTTRGKTTETTTVKLKGGEKVNKESIKPLLRLAGGNWWRNPEDLDDAEEGDVVITENITMKIVVTRDAEESDQTDSGDAPTDEDIDESMSGDEETQEDDTTGPDGAEESEAEGGEEDGAEGL